MKHDRIVPASEYEELLEFKRIVESKPELKVSFIHRGMQPSINYIGDNAIEEVLEIDYQKLKINKTTTLLTRLFHDFYDKNIISVEKEKVKELETEIELLKNEKIKLNSDNNILSQSNINLKSLIENLNKEIIFLNDDIQKYRKDITDNKNWFERWFF